MTPTLGDLLELMKEMSEEYDNGVTHFEGILISDFLKETEDELAKYFKSGEFGQPMNYIREYERIYDNKSNT